MEKENSLNISEILRQERLARSWIIRYPIDIYEFVWYGWLNRFWYFLSRTCKWKIQEWVRGYSDADLWNLNYFIIKKVRKPLNAFVKHQEERGMSLPSDFEKDPAAWLVVLGKMRYSFDQSWLNENDENHDFLHTMTDEQRMEYYNKIQEGFELFGKYLTNLWN